MNLILKLTNSNNVIDYSKVYLENLKKIIDGSLIGMEGLIKEFNNKEGIDKER